MSAAIAASHGRVDRVDSSSPDAAAAAAADEPVAPQPVDDETTAVIEIEGDTEAGKTAKTGRSVLRWVAPAVLVAILAGAGYEGWLLFQHHQRDAAAAQALEAAEKYAVALTGVDPNAIDKNFAEVLDGATGEFKRMYSESAEHLRQLLIENKAAAHGTVVEAAVKSAAKNRVEVMLFIDQSVSNKAAPGPQIDRSRIVITMEKVGDRWLAGNVDMP